MELKYYDHVKVMTTVKKMDFDNMIIVYDLQSEKYVSVKKNINLKKVNRHNIKVNQDD